MTELAILVLAGLSVLALTIAVVELWSALRSLGRLKP